MRTTTPSSRCRIRPGRVAAVPFLVVALVLAACAASSGDDAVAVAGDRGWLDDDVTWGGPSPSRPGRDAADTAAEPESGYAAAGEADEDGSRATTGGESAFEVAPELGLRAGSVDDNERFEAYLRYRDAFLASGIAAHDRDVSGLRLVRVVDGAGRPVLGALVVVESPDGSVVDQARTVADGRVALFPPPGDVDANQQGARYTAVVEHRGDRVEVELGTGREVLEVVLDGERSTGRTELDLHFLIDATGSMADEIERLKAHMMAVAERVADLPAAPDVRFSLTAYRDVGDAFLHRTFDFTADVASFTAALREVEADGGGDEPEALNEALAAALSEPAWRDGEVVRLMVLVADAPPHLDREPSYLASIDVARARGLKILPIASSGSNDQAEYVFRQLAQQTLARFTFLTYGADGISPGDATVHHVDDYSVLALDELIVQLVTDELAHRA